FGRTEVIDNTLNPDFVRKYILDYFFEEKQNLRFDVYDIDSKSPDLAKHDFLGQVFCTLGEIVGSPASRLEKQLVALHDSDYLQILQLYHESAARWLKSRHLWEF
ncbi:Copine-5, partial [Ameca splendens]